MLAILKLIQSIFKTLHSEGTPRQVAAGMALGACIELTPLLNLHNLVIISLIALLNVSFGGGMLGIAFFTPFGFALDPLFPRAGPALLAFVVQFLLVLAFPVITIGDMVRRSKLYQVVTASRLYNLYRLFDPES